MITYQQAQRDITEIIRAGEKQAQTFGGEFEHFIINRQTLQTYDYYEPNGIRSILLQLKALGWQSSDDEAKITHLEKGKAVVTLEPGAQIEVSILPCHCVEQMAQHYMDFIADIKRVLLPEQAIISIGYRPATKVADVPFIPKDRYKAMAEYFNQTGIYAHNMMKGTASTQVAIDFSNEQDCRDKFRMFNALSPFISTYLDSTPFFEGQVVDGHNMRMRIWEKTDTDRSGVCIAAFDDDFDYAAYADIVLNTPPILVLTEYGVAETERRPFKDLLNEVDYSNAQLQHVMTMLFPDVRLKHFIEVRMADAMPYPYNIGYVELIKILAYDKAILAEYVAWAKTVSYSDIAKLKADIITQGTAAHFRGETIYDFMVRLMDRVLTSAGATDFVRALNHNYRQPTSFAKRLSALDQTTLINQIEVKSHA